MREEDFETAIKVVVVGNGAVGKSSMIQRYCKGVFTQEYKKTIGVDFLERQIDVSGEDVRLMLWDTAGQEEFDAITKAYYRGAQACVLVFSTLDRDSFKAVESWKKKVENECGSIPTVLVQNKIDMVEQAVVNRDEAEDLAKRLKVRFYRTSVKEDLNVSDVFRYLATKYLHHMNDVTESTLEKHSTSPSSQNHLSGNLVSKDVLKSHFQGGGGGGGRRSSSNNNGGGNTNGTITLHQPRKKSGKKGFKKTCRLF